MNFRNGLKRISAVFWGFWGLLDLLIAIYAAKTEPFQGLIGLAILIPIYLLHKLTCWVIAGFFSSESHP